MLFRQLWLRLVQACGSKISDDQATERKVHDLVSLFGQGKGVLQSQKTFHFWGHVLADQRKHCGFVGLDSVRNLINYSAKSCGGSRNYKCFTTTASGEASQIGIGFIV